MRIHPSAVLVGTLLMMTPPGVRAQDGAVTGDPVKGAALLAEARQALGGEEKLRAIKTLQAKGSFKRTAGNNQLEGDVELLIELPGKMKRTEDMSLPGGGPAVVVTQTLNGEQVWDENTGGRGGFGFGGPGGGRGFGGGGRGFGGGRGGQQGGGDNANAAGTAGGRRGNIDPEQLRQAQVRQRQAELSRLGLAWLLSTDGSIEWIGTAQSPDGTADVLEVRETDGTVSTRLFLDAASHMPLMITWQGNVPNFRRGGPAGGRGDGGAAPGDGGALPGGGDQAQAPRRGGPPAPVTLQMTMADYKAVNGVKLPQTITRGTAGQTTEEWSVSSYKVNPAFKAGTFEQKR